MAVDPVCKMDVDPKEAKEQTDYQGKTYHFCTPGCKHTFEENPEKYVDRTPKGGCPGCCGC